MKSSEEGGSVCCPALRHCRYRRSFVKVVVHAVPAQPAHTGRVAPTGLRRVGPAAGLRAAGTPTARDSNAWGTGDWVCELNWGVRPHCQPGKHSLTPPCRPAGLFPQPCLQRNAQQRQYRSHQCSDRTVTPNTPCGLRYAREERNAAGARARVGSDQRLGVAGIRLSDACGAQWGVGGQRTVPRTCC